MNDLSGLNWDNKQSALPLRSQSAVPVTRPSFPLPLSRGPTPLPSQLSGSLLPASSGPKPTIPAAQDSFASLLGSSSTKKTNSLSLQERQKQLLEEKARQTQSIPIKASNGHFGGDETFWNGLGSGRNTPAQAGYTPPIATSQSFGKAENGDDDLFAAFNASAPVDSSSHFPPPPVGSSRTATPDVFSQRPISQHTSQPPRVNLIPEAHTLHDDDDDPFGLGQFEKKRDAKLSQVVAEDNDDILGMLGQPVQKKPVRKVARSPPRPTKQDDEFIAGANSDPRDSAIAELVDMGFSAETARNALEATDFDVQSAVGLILNQAHEASKNKQQSRQNTGLSAPEPRREPARTDSRGREAVARESVPSWMRAEVEQQRQDSRSPASSERDVAQYATEIGSTLFKSANSLFKAGRKQVQKAMAELQEPEGDAPRWMRDPADEAGGRRPARPSANVTDEAMMLESGRSTPAPPASRKPRAEQTRDAFPPELRRPSPLASNESMRPPPGQEYRAPQKERQPPRPTPQPPAKLNRLLVEEQSAEAYISPARRRKAPAPAPVPEIADNPEPRRQPAPPVAPPEPEMDIFSDEISAPIAKPSQPASSSVSARPVAIRPNTTTRAVPSVSSFVLSASASYRQKGTEAFKRGDYSEAQTHYTTAMSGLPATHPILIIILCNRALTNIKTGDPKAAVLDADTALNSIGPSRGENESIALGAGEPEKPMKEFYGKALLRKAEAYEHMERWDEAAAAWRQAVEAGVGGAVSIQGRNRCEKAAGKSSTVAANAAPRRAATPAKPVRRPAPQVASNKESEAVKRLRAANEAAAAASDEAFALNDAVEARLAAWKAGKEGNLRALLASLDTILWADAGWKKVGMGDLVMPNKVKIIYMKAIGKVHPDKISQSATTEQKMISAAVFANLNGAWDKFKTDNNL